jgi:hypothetical protein
MAQMTGAKAGAKPAGLDDAMLSLLESLELSEDEAGAVLANVKAPERPESDGYEGPPIGPSRRR